MSFYLIRYLTLISQSSSLWIRLMLVIRVILLVYELIRLLPTRGLVSLLILLIFVGGLLVLLVRVSTLSLQDQTLMIRSLILFLCITLLFFPSDNRFISTLTVFSWFIITPRLLLIIIVLLLQGFITITWVLLNYKTRIRLI